MNGITFKKRRGTSGIKGQLYETKLISLIYFRAKNNPNIKDFHVASNIDDAGAFDDICIKVKCKNHNRPIAVFVQAKHRETDQVLTLNSKNDLAKYFESYLNIRRAFKPNNKELLFKGDYEKTDCVFVMYTNARDDLNNTVFDGIVADFLNHLVGTGPSGLQPRYKNEDLQILCKIIVKEQFTSVAVNLAKCLCEENDNIMSMNDDLILSYHVILAHSVLDVSGIKRRHEDDEHRVANFRQNFFISDDEFISLFRNTLFMEVLKKRKLKDTEITDLLKSLFREPSDVTLSKLVVNVIIFNNGKLNFVNKMPDDIKHQLDKVKVTESMVKEAIQNSAKEILAKGLKVPAAFGNKDLTIRGKLDINIENKLTELKTKFVGLLLNAKEDFIIVIDDALGKDFLKLNGGFAGVIGNMLLYDEDAKEIKFTQKPETLGDLAARLFRKIQDEVGNLQKFKFNLKAKKLPRLNINFGHKDEDLEKLKIEMIALAEQITSIFGEDENYIFSMDNELVLRYHVILTQKVFEISEINMRNEDGEHRVAKFRKEFFETNEEVFVTFKEKLYIETVKRRTNEMNREILLSKHLNESLQVNILSQLITFKNDKLGLTHPTAVNTILDNTKFSKTTIDKALEVAAKQILIKVHFKVPAAFGNKDLTIRGEKGVKIERRLNHLKLKISELIKKSGKDSIVSIDETLEDGLLKLSGGIAGIVGNILVRDEDTSLLKVTDYFESLGNISKRLLLKLQSEIPNLYQYKFEMKVKQFPRLSFESTEHEESLAKDFLSKLLFYTNQKDQSGVEEILKNEIEDHECTHNLIVVSKSNVDAIFLKYHDEIQKWWLKADISHLTKQTTHYENSVKSVIDKPLLSLITSMYLIKLEQYIIYKFNDDAINILKNQGLGSITVTKNSALTVVKMLQHISDKDHAILDLEYVLNLHAHDFSILRTELIKTSKEKIIIIVCDNIPCDRNWATRLENLATAVTDKLICLVINKNLIDTIKRYFVKHDNILVDDRIKLIDLNEESQKMIIDNASVIFQGNEVNLNLFIDDDSKAFLDVDILNQIINHEPLTVGKTVSNSNYEKRKHLYIERRLMCSSKLRPNTIYYGAEGTTVRNLNDINNKVVLLTAKPGMGKSTLLTHLSVKTKELHPSTWVVRINLLDHTKQFLEWQTNKTVIDTLEALTFLCRSFQNENREVEITLEDTDNIVNVKNCKGDEEAIFEMKMFIHYYNKRDIIFLFDGFDEICPHYAEEVLKLLKIVRHFPQNHKMWVTSRPYDDVKSDLEDEFGNSMVLMHFTEGEQDSYMRLFWQSKTVFRNFNRDQFNNLISFMEFMSNHYHVGLTHGQKVVKREKHQFLFLKVCFNFLMYLKKELDVCPTYINGVFQNFFGNCKHRIGFTEYFDTPLYLFLVADYLQNKIKDTKIPNQWNLDINAFVIYEHFFEMKLKKIRFEEKNKIDLSKPDNLIIYEKLREDFFTIHKKLGAFAIFVKDAHKVFNSTELSEINATIEKIKNGIEKTGLIYNVVNNIPVFIHMSFTEYFAVEYLSDLLQLKKSNEEQRNVWDFILNVVFFAVSKNFLYVMNYRVKIDDKLKMIIKEDKYIIFNLLLEQGKGVHTYYPNDFSKYLYDKVKILLNQVMQDDLSKFILHLHKLKRILTDEYIEDRSRVTPKIRRIKFNNLVRKKRQALLGEEEEPKKLDAVTRIHRRVVPVMQKYPEKSAPVIKGSLPEA